VAALLAIEDVFPPDLTADAGFRSAVTEAYDGLSWQGARAMVEALTA